MNNEKNSEWYDSLYSRISITGDATSRAGKLMHQFLEHGKKNLLMDRTILEIGVNNGEHIKFVSGRWKKYIALDLRTPSQDVLDSFKHLGVEFILGDAHSLPFPDEIFDEVIVTCVLHHVEKPELVIQEIRRVLRIGGKAFILVPNDPGISYRIIRHFTSVRRAKKLNFKKELQDLHYREHRNHYLSLLNYINGVFSYDEKNFSFFPFFFRGYDINLLTRVKVTKKIAENLNSTSI